MLQHALWHDAENFISDVVVEILAVSRRFTQTRIGGAGRDRTDDLKLAKLPLSQLSYAPKQMWWAREDLNLRPHAYQACALTN